MHLTYRWQATLVIGLGLLMAVLDVTIVSVVLPQIATAFHTEYQTSTWIGTGYLLANAAVIPIIGYISDRVGSKTIFLLALGLFTLGSALCAFAPNEPALIAFRIFQGIGGGALLPVGMAIIFRLFDPTERAGATALLMIPVLLGPAFGPTLGGYLATIANWNAIFLINLPIGVVAFLLALLVLRGKADEQEAERLDRLPETRRFDWLGLVLAMASFTVLVYSITLAGTNGWSSPIVIGELLAGFVLLFAFVLVELLVKDPVMDLRLFRNYTFTVANVLAWVSSAVFFASLFLVPVFFERVEQLSALTTGEIVIAQGLAMAVGLAFSGRLYNRVGPRVLAVSGAILITGSMFGFTRLTVTTTGADLQFWLILRGLGLGLFMQPLQTLTVSVVSKEQMARATSLTSSTRTVAGAVGVAVLTSYLTQMAPTHLKEASAACIAQTGQHLQPFALHVCIGQQTMTMGMNDTFFFALIACAFCAVVTIFVGRDPALEEARVAKSHGEKSEERAPMTVVTP
ncbi:MAG: multidrug efflux MFS transporter [Chloroflexota bacterium]|nr:multidrug efflux MFS transporter [Chloroflexota bacterium]